MSPHRNLWDCLLKLKHHCERAQRRLLARYRTVEDHSSTVPYQASRGHCVFSLLTVYES